MMDFMLNLELSIIDMDDTYDKFCESLDELNLLYEQEDFYIEAIEDENKTFMDRIKGVKGPLHDTRKSTKDVLKAYNDVTTSSGNLMKTLWNIMMKGFHLAVKVLVYIINTVAKIPDFINNLLKNIISIPEEVRRKIRGDIKLYIPLQDLELFQKKIFPHIIRFSNAANEIRKGNMFGTFFNRRNQGDSGIKKILFTENDIKYARIMLDAFNKMKNIRFSKTNIEINNPAIMKLYFGGENSYEYVNREGKKVKGNYYSALIDIFEHIREYDFLFKELKEDLSMKFDETITNRKIEGLSDNNKNLIKDTMEIMVKFINMMGNLIRYIVADMKTLDGCVNKILNKK